MQSGGWGLYLCWGPLVYIHWAKSQPALHMSKTYINSQAYYRHCFSWFLPIEHKWSGLSVAPCITVVYSNVAPLTPKLCSQDSFRGTVAVGFTLQAIRYGLILNVLWNILYKAEETVTLNLCVSNTFSWYFWDGAVAAVVEKEGWQVLCWRIVSLSLISHLCISC